MGQLYILKANGLLFEEIYSMTAEERAWWVKRLEKDREEMLQNSSDNMKLMP